MSSLRGDNEQEGRGTLLQALLQNILMHLWLQQERPNTVFFIDWVDFKPFCCSIFNFMNDERISCSLI